MPSPVQRQTPEQDAEEIERFSDQLAKRVADLLMEGAYRIRPEHAAEIEANYPRGWTSTNWIVSGVNPVVIESRILSGGHVDLTLRLANGETIWRATLRP